MSVAAPAERAFATFSRGDQREDMLASFRAGLRKLVNPDTGTTFSETEIATATAQFSRWYAEADALDLLLLAAGQQRGLWLADQVRVDRASTGYLRGYHGPQWIPAGALPAVGGSGSGTALAAPGAVFPGSTTIPDPVAAVATDPAGLRYQVLSTEVANGSGVATLTFEGVDTGQQTNIPSGTKLTWSANQPISAIEPATTTEDFTGGIAAESDADFAKRILSRIRHKPASGNSAHFRAWARDASNAVEDAAIYACAYHSGSVHVAVLQKRGSVKGPLGRIAAPGTVVAVRNYLVPPASPVVPKPPHVVVSGTLGEPVDYVLSLSMANGRSSGWADLQPWPVGITGPAFVTNTVSQTSWRITLQIGASAALPSGVTAPQLMVWDAPTSRFEKLDVLSVVPLGGVPPQFQVTLASPPAHTMTDLDYISPYTRRLDVIATTVEAYFDSLGPGELVDLATDLRAHRAFRFPPPNEELPQRAGSSVLTFLEDALGASLSDSALQSVSLALPDVPADPALGPNLLVAGNLGIIPF